MKRLLLTLSLVLGTAGALFSQADSPLVQALVADPVQASYLARHPEILRFIGKHPQLDAPAKNKAINEWIAAWPALAKLLAQEPDKALAWAEDPVPLEDLAKKGHK